MTANRVDLLEFLLVNPKTFSMMGHEQQLELAKNRPTPFLDIKEYVNGIKMHFQTQWYTTYYWLTGSLMRQKLYCFICLLYGQVFVISREEGECSSFHDKANDHQNSRHHIKNCEQHAHLINNQSNKLSIADSKKDIWLEGSRKSFKKVLQLLYVTARISFKNVEQDDVNILEELMTYLSSNEIVVSAGSALNYSGITSEVVQKDMILALRIVTKELIIEEISKTDFITILIDSVDEKPFSCERYSLIARYVNEDSVVERFLTFFETPKNATGEAVFESAYRILTDWGIEKKLVCMSYDIPRVHIISKNINIAYKNEDYIKPLVLHNCNYNLCWIMWNVCLKIPSVVNFMNDVTLLYKFFNDKKRYLQFIEEGISIPASMFNFDNQRTFKCPKTFLSMLAKNFLTLKNAVNLVSQKCSWDTISVLMAQKIAPFMKSAMSVYTLCFFNKLFVRLDHLACFVRLMSYKDISRILQELQTTISSLFNMNSEESIMKLWEEAAEIMGTNFGEQVHLNYVEVKAAFSNIVVHIIKNIRKRFYDYYSLHILELINFKKNSKEKLDMHSIFQKYLDTFNIFNFDKLHNELLIIYSDSSKHMEPEALINYLKNNGLECVFDETIKFIHFIQILPLSAVVQNKQTKYERVKKFAELYLMDSKLSEYDSLIIERDLLDNHISDDNFVKKVLNEFVKLDMNNSSSYFHNGNI